MTYAHITIDGNTILDTHLDQWQPTPPAALADIAKQGSTENQPGNMALLFALGHAIKTDQDITINLRNRDTGYDLTVHHGQR